MFSRYIKPRISAFSLVKHKCHTNSICVNNFHLTVTVIRHPYTVVLSETQNFHKITKSACVNCVLNFLENIGTYPHLVDFH